MNKSTSLGKYMLYSGWGYHLFFVCRNGTLYGAGFNSYGQLSLGNNDSPQDKFIRISQFVSKVITDISTGECHSLFFTRKSCLASGLYKTIGTTLPSGKTGKEEKGSLKESCLSAKKIISMSREHVIKGSAGYSASYYVTNLGRVYSVGENCEGELCVGDTRARKELTRVKGLNDIDYVIGGYESVVFATKLLRSIYVGGRFREMLAHEFKYEYCTAVKLDDHLGNVKVSSITIASNSMFLTTEKSGVWIFGKNSYGVFGIDREVWHYDEDDNQDIFRIPMLSPNPIMRNARNFGGGGDDFVVFSSNGLLYGCGYNAGSLGFGHRDTVKIATRIEKVPENVCQIVCSLFNGFLITENGTVYASGNNEHRQLCRKTGGNSDLFQYLLGPPEFKLKKAKRTCSKGHLEFDYKERLAFIIERNLNKEITLRGIKIFNSMLLF